MQPDPVLTFERGPAFTDRSSARQTRSRACRHLNIAVAQEIVVSHVHRPFVSRREFLRRTALAGAATAAGPWVWRQPAYAAAAPAEQLHLVFGADASREMTVSWMTPAPVKRPFVQIVGTRVAADTVQYDGYPGYFHQARMDWLEPATRYRYAVGHADRVAARPARLQTGPSGRKAFTFTAFGDQGIDDPGPDNIQDYDPTTGSVSLQQPPFQAEANIRLAQSLDPAFHLIVGDLSYANGNQAIWDRWFRAIEPMASRTPWMACLGNHEIEAANSVGGFGLASDSWGPLGYDAYRTRFAFPANGDREWDNCWYAFRYGSVQFLSIDNNDVNTEVTANIGYSEGRQAAFVERVLRRAHRDPDIDFTIVLMHQCAFSSSTKHGSDEGVRKAWLDLFARTGVDLVLQGHDHTYERSHLMDRTEVLSAEAPYVSDVGTLYVVAGNGGAVQEPFNPQQPAWSAFRQALRVGTLRVDVNPDTGKGTKRLTLSEYAALDGSPIEEGIVLERPLGARAGVGSAAPREAAPAVAAPAGVGLVGTAAADGGARLRTPTPDDV
jgi:3',5'-cyclic AMP phosphodiesterase CpdA